MGKICRVNVLFGPAKNPSDCEKMISSFFANEGIKVVCGGTTANLVAKFLNKPLLTDLCYESEDIPPVAKIQGVNLVTEGIITLKKVLCYAKDYVENKESRTTWIHKKDGAARICKLLFEQADFVNFYVGTAINAANQDPNLPIDFNIKENLTVELSSCLTKMGKNVIVSYF